MHLYHRTIGPHLLIGTLLLLSVFTAHTQTSWPALYRAAIHYYDIDDPTPHTDSLALQKFQQAAALLESQSPGETPSPGNDSVLADCYLKAGIMQLSFRSSRKALPLFLSAARTTERQPRSKDALLFQPWLYAGSCYYDLYDLDSALYYYRLAENILDKYPSQPEAGRLFNKLGVLYYESGDYKRSIQYFSKALDIVKSHRPSDMALVVNYQNNIASALLKMKSFQKAIDIYKDLLHYRSYRNELLYNIGAAYLDSGVATSGIHWLQESKASTQAKYNSLARACLLLGKNDEAAKNIELAMAVHRRSGIRQKTQDLANTFRYRGHLLLAKDSAAAALVQYQQAIIQLDRDFDDPSPEHNPSSFSGFHNSFLLFDALVAKARAYLAIRPGSPDLLVHAHDAYNAALELARHVEIMYYSDEARLFLVEKVDPVYKEAVALQYRIYRLKKDQSWLEKMFLTAEAGKASVLQARLGDPGLSLPKGQAHDLLMAARKKQAEAAKLDLQLKNEGDSIAITRLQSMIRDIELEVSSLFDKLDRHPEYRQRKPGLGDLSIASIQKDILSKDHALLSYFYTDSDLFCFYMTASTFGCISIDSLPALRSDILSLRRQLDAGMVTDMNALNELTMRVSRQLIDPVYGRITGRSRLIIIPYNEIAYLPFEMLLGPLDHQPLVKVHAISYNYSAGFLSGSRRPAPAAYQVLALVPFIDAQGQAPQLKSSSSEVAGLPGKILLGSAATRAAFLQWMPHYPIVHLATHAVVNDADPLTSYIELYNPASSATASPDRLFEQEIYHLGMDSISLVILSACETGKGNLVSGEGLFSLSRAFSYAGCRSVITSLWKAEDAATAYITASLHHHLLEGEPRDRALQLAKLDYLEDRGIERRFKTPSFWAHLVLLGDYKPVAEKKHGLWLLIGAVIFFLFMAVSILFLKPTGGA